MLVMRVHVTESRYEIPKYRVAESGNHFKKEQNKLMNTQSGYDVRRSKFAELYENADEQHNGQREI